MRKHWLCLSSVCFLFVLCARLVAADTASNIAEGDKLFHARCGYCHLAGGTGTFMVGRRLGKDKALLEDRTDLTPVYIRTCVRVGIGSMPAHTRIELPDRELDLITAYLTRPASAREAQK